MALSVNWGYFSINRKESVINKMIKLYRLSAFSFVYNDYSILHGTKIEDQSLIQIDEARTHHTGTDCISCNMLTNIAKTVSKSLQSLFNLFLTWYLREFINICLIISCETNYFMSNSHVLWVNIEIYNNICQLLACKTTCIVCHIGERVWQKW